MKSAVPSDQQRLLDAFLVDNTELETLNARLATFNLFSVLRVDRAEIRHSNVLAWLLNPDGSHGLGDMFLRRFLSRLLLENEGVAVQLTPAQVELMDLSGVDVLREWHNIDIAVHDRARRWCLLIENKIGSRESPGQLTKYVDAARVEMPRAEIIPVYLTLEGADPSESGQAAGYVALSHSQVLEIAERIIDQNRRRIPSDASVFLAHYLDTLRRLTMQDQELVELCRAIYRKHREAIDLIVEYGVSSQVLDVCEEHIKTLVDCEFVLSKGSMVWFLPREMATHLPDVPMNGWPGLPRNVAVLCWLTYRKKEGKLHAALEVGPMAEPAKRIALMHAIKDAGFSFWEEGAFKETAKYTRIASCAKKLRFAQDGEPDDSTDYVKQVTEGLWQKLWQDGSRIVDVLRDFDWDMSAGTGTHDAEG